MTCAQKVNVSAVQRTKSLAQNQSGQVLYTRRTQARTDISKAAAGASAAASVSPSLALLHLPECGELSFVMLYLSHMGPELKAENCVTHKDTESRLP